ncbi:MAG: M43 family zinc metalloprotease [Flavitalea sp.]
MRDFVLVSLLLFITLYNCYAQSECASHTYYQQESVTSQAFLKRMQGIEIFIRNRLSNNEPRMSPPGLTGGGMSVIQIPVVVHVIYNNGDQKISEEQVRSQIDVLNRDFRKLNPDIGTLPDPFKSLAADCFIEFHLATIDPQGGPTKGIVWKHTDHSSFGSDDKIKFSRTGGDDAWDSERYLNIWVGKLSTGIVGYASAPGAAKEKDGIVLRYTAFGTIGTAASPYNLGRTAVHESGHWLGLKHIWGDRYCGDDKVADTPPQKGPTPGCPSGVLVSCDNSTPGSMYMNFMDITHDACTNLFTVGQRERMRALFVDGGPRHSILTQMNHAPMPSSPVDTPPDGPIYLTRIFPNPAAKQVTLNTKNVIGEKLTVRTQLGQVVVQTIVTSNTIQIDISNLRNGLYFVQVGSKEKAQKLVKSTAY